MLSAFRNISANMSSSYSQTCCGTSSIFFNQSCNIVYQTYLCTKLFCLVQSPSRNISENIIVLQFLPTPSPLQPNYTPLPPTPPRLISSSDRSLLHLRQNIFHPLSHPPPTCKYISNSLSVYHFLNTEAQLCKLKEFNTKEMKFQIKIAFLSYSFFYYQETIKKQTGSA